MRIAILCLFIATITLFDAESLNAQSLSDDLKSESLATLALDAREKGDAIRGAVLFNRKGIECGRCHATGSDDLLGPDLSKLPDERTDEQLVESILFPSKVIREGFETATIVTIDGRVLKGRIIEKSDEATILRADDESGILLRLSAEDIEESAQDPVSLMPDGIVNELSSRQQFLDVVRYVMQTSENVSFDAIEHFEPLETKPLDGELAGVSWMDRLNCAACHQASLPMLAGSTSHGPNLQWLSGRVAPDHIERFIRNPHQAKPGTRMPDMLSHLGEDERKQIAAELTQFIVSLGANDFERQSLDPESFARGSELFHTVGCVACHAPQQTDDETFELGSFASLGSLANKYNLNSLTEFLEDPHAARPSGRMPNMKLTHWEAMDLANYLLGKDPSIQSDVTSTLKLDDALVESGRRHFVSLRCVNCHAIDSNALDSVANADRSIDINEVEGGCLGGEQGNWPNYQLSDQTRDLVSLALQRKNRELTSADHISVTMSSLNCLSCHQRGDLGGVTAVLDEFFQTTDQNLGQQGRIPPTLTGVGAKLRSQWMREVLVSGRSIRPYMLTRMPQFGASHVEHLIDKFQEVDSLPEVELVEGADEKLMRDTGLQLAGTGGLNCVACHTYRYEKSDTMPAVDLTEMAQRLNQEWFYAYMQSPQRYSRNTVMPSFWPGGEAVRKEVLDGDTLLQVEALWQYLSKGRDARAPRGVVREPLEVLASSDEAVMLRRSYSGIGKRGIGVGYPTQVNLAYDAEQMRLALLWKGKFAEASGVWRGQGSGTVRPLAGRQVRFPTGPELDFIETPWQVDEGRPPNHQFKGYYLDEAQRPTFMYLFDGIKVEDYPVDVQDVDSGDSDGEPIRRMKRTLTFEASAPRDDVAFRVATDPSITSEGDGVFRVGESLEIRVSRPHDAEVIETESGMQLRVPLSLPAGESRLELEYVW